MSFPLIVHQLPPRYLVSRIQQTSTFLLDSVSTTSHSSSLSVYIVCSHSVSTGSCLIHYNGLTLPPTPERRPSRRRYQQTLDIYRCLLAPPNSDSYSDSIVVIAIKILELLFLWNRLSWLKSQLSSLTASEHARRSRTRAVCSPRQF